MAGLLGGDAGVPGVPTTYVEDIVWWAPWGPGLRSWSKGVL
jgi:hypothetical protein